MGTWAAVTPAWVRPNALAVDDLHWVSYRVATETGSRRAAGIGGALAWVRGGRTGPVTARDEQPVTEAIAQVEQWAAISMQDSKAPPPVHLIAERLNVPMWPVQPVDTQWATGVYMALAWLLGEGSGKPPLSLPVRNLDGTVSTAQQMYEAAVAVRPWRYELPEEQITLRSKCEAAARKSRQMADLIEDTQRRLAVA